MRKEQEEREKRIMFNMKWKMNYRPEALKQLLGPVTQVQEMMFLETQTISHRPHTFKIFQKLKKGTLILLD